MGGLGSGVQAKPHQREAMARLRAQGLTYRAIGHRLRLSDVCVRVTLLKMGLRSLERVPVRCASCGLVAGKMHLRGRRFGPVVCLSCLDQRPDATFAQRLKACRVAAGLTLPEVAQQSGVALGALHRYMINFCYPRRTTLAKLIGVLGPRLLPPGQPPAQSVKPQAHDVTFPGGALA
jgi:hypothetical protein